VTADGGVPVFTRAYDGGAGQVGQVVGAMQALQKHAGPARMLIVGDSELVSYTNLATMIDQKVAFIAPASKTYVPVEVLAAQDLNQAVEVDYVAARDTDKPAEKRGRWHVREDTMTLAGPRKKDPVLTLRRIFVHSTARAQAAATARAKKLDRAAGDLARLSRGLGSRHYPASDGWYALLTNQTPTDASPADVLHSDKGQETVERRYHGFKGPLAVAPTLLRNNKRMTALITVICLALLTYCLIERQIRNAIAPATTLPGLNAARPAKPTTQLIFKALRTLRMIPARNGNPPEIPQPSPHQLHPLNLLAVDPRRPHDG
jgi:transposase